MIGAFNRVRALMKNLVFILYLLLFPCAHVQASTVVIRGVTVVDVSDGSLHPGQTVLVAGNRIEAVGSVREVAAPDDAKVVEAAGRVCGTCTSTQWPTWR